MSDFFDDPIWQIANSEDPKKELKKYERTVMKRLLIVWVSFAVLCYGLSGLTDNTACKCNHIRTEHSSDSADYLYNLGKCTVKYCQCKKFIVFDK